MADTFLTLNSGSSSIKFSLFALAGGALDRVGDGEIEGIGGEPHFVARVRGAEAGAHAVERRWPDGPALTHEALLGEVLEWVDGYLGPDPLNAVGHRIVQGGADFAGTARPRLRRRLARTRVRRFLPAALLGCC